MESVVTVILVFTYVLRIVKGYDKFCPLQNVCFPIIMFSRFSAQSPCVYCTDHTVSNQIQIPDWNFY